MNSLSQSQTLTCSVIYLCNLIAKLTLYLNCLTATMPLVNKDLYNSPVTRQPLHIGSLVSYTDY
jgi:hypothetical protein